jgi:hypothetical protein
MKGMTKTAFVVAAVLVGAFAYCFSHERTQVLQHAPGASTSRMMEYLGLFFLSLIILVLLSVCEVIKFFKNRAESWMFQAGSSREPSPELQEAERVRASGDPLEAIRLLREHLQTNPYELRAMSRIAEIYRYDLKNDLAAALEYEELLKHKLPDDQWSWAALHLAKLYGRLNELEKSVALLERLDNDYGHTVAGRRAKKALEQVRNPGGELAEDEEQETEN